MPPTENARPSLRDLRGSVPVGRAPVGGVPVGGTQDPAAVRAAVQAERARRSAPSA